MFTHQLTKNNALYQVVFSDFAKKHFLKSFEKKHKGLIWKATETSIFYDLARIQQKLQLTQQVDELAHDDDEWYFKYDFSIAKSGKSPKASGNRCLCKLEESRKLITILTIYHKDDLPKNMSETAWVRKIMEVA